MPGVGGPTELHSWPLVLDADPTPLHPWRFVSFTLIPVLPTRVGGFTPVLTDLPQMLRKPGQNQDQLPALAPAELALAPGGTHSLQGQLSCSPPLTTS